MGWSKVQSNGFGGYQKKRDDRGQNESLHGRNYERDRIKGDHVHYHKDGATVTKDGRKYTMKGRYCSGCQKDTKQKTTDNGISYTCLHCGRNQYGLTLQSPRLGFVF